MDCRGLVSQRLSPLKAIRWSWAVTQATINGIKSGAAYVFVRNGTTWSEQQRLTASDALGNDGFGHFDNFGRAVGISGNSIIVTAPTHLVGANVEQGAAYVFVRSGTVWSEQARILAEDGDARNNFGQAASIDGDTAVVSRGCRPQIADVNPAVYVFVRNGTTWQQQQRLSLCEPSSLDLCDFGCSVAVKSDTLIVGNQIPQCGFQRRSRGRLCVLTHRNNMDAATETDSVGWTRPMIYFGSRTGY